MPVDVTFTSILPTEWVLQREKVNTRNYKVEMDRRVKLINSMMNLPPSNQDP